MPLTPQAYPILEFDPERSAIINPDHHSPPPGLPDRAVLCFFIDLLQQMAAEGRLMVAYMLGSELGPNPIYRLETPAGAVLVAHPGVGAPFSAAVLEEVIALGADKIIACGGCGVLRPDIAAGHAVVLDAAVRDEGVSYHYLPPSREVKADPRGIVALEGVLGARGIPYLRGKAWTTDAFYRETPERRALRIAEGCDVVEMEAAAFFAVAQFRGVTLGQVVYGGDLVVPEGWDDRNWDERQDDRRLMFDVAVEAALAL